VLPDGALHHQPELDAAQRRKSLEHGMLVAHQHSQLDLDGGEHRLLLAGAVQALSQGEHSQRRAVQHLEGGEGLRVVLDPPLDLGRAAHDHHERVSQVVGRPGRNAADGGHALGPQQHPLLAKLAQQELVVGRGEGQVERADGQRRDDDEAHGEPLLDLLGAGRVAGEVGRLLVEEGDEERAHGQVDEADRAGIDKGAAVHGRTQLCKLRNWPMCAPVSAWHGVAAGRAAAPGPAPVQSSRAR